LINATFPTSVAGHLSFFFFAIFYVHVRRSTETCLIKTMSIL